MPCMVDKDEQTFSWPVWILLSHERVGEPDALTNRPLPGEGRMPIAMATGEPTVLAFATYQDACKYRDNITDDAYKVLSLANPAECIDLFGALVKDGSASRIGFNTRYDATGSIVARFGTLRDFLEWMQRMIDDV